MARCLTDAVPMSRALALQLCQCEMGDYVEMADGRVMRLDDWEGYTKRFRGRVMLQEKETIGVVAVSDMLVKVGADGRAYRELRVKSGAFPLVHREAVEPSVLEPSALSLVNSQESLVQHDEAGMG